MSLKKSPLAPATFPDLPAIQGVSLASIAAGIKYAERDDVLLAVFEPGASAAGVFTQSLTASAPVELCRANLGTETARALVVNSGNANAFTGSAGERCCATVAAEIANAVGAAPEEVFQASTGVIGEPLDPEKIVVAIPDMMARLTPAGWLAAASAIMTTDTFPKGVTGTAKIGDTRVVINGIAKGSGMIAPDMATMLAYFFTDAEIPASLLQALLEEANAGSFNAITVDSDTSTSDTNMLFATGAAGNPIPAGIDDPSLAEFRALLKSLMQELAIQVVRDGEGASKLIRVQVTGADSDSAARSIALAVANSPLVKTAVAGEDANWGRVVMAVGKSGQRAERDRLRISMGGVLITEYGQVVADYDESQVAAHLTGQEIEIEVDLGLGKGNFTVWTCDLTHGYISINADYRS